MKLAIPIFNGRVAPVFDWSSQIVMAEVTNGEFPSQSEADIAEVPVQSRAAFLADAEVNVLICGGISGPMAAMLEDRGIRILPGIAGNVEEVLKAFMAGQIEQPQWAMPGWCGHAGRGSGGGRRGRGHCGRDGGWKGSRSQGAGLEGGIQ